MKYFNNTLLLHDCCEQDMIYGIIQTDMSADDFQDEIHEVKHKFFNDLINTWTIEDVFEEMWEKGIEFSFTQIDMYRDFLEI